MDTLCEDLCAFLHAEVTGWGIPSQPARYPHSHMKEYSGESLWWCHHPDRCQTHRLSNGHWPPGNSDFIAAICKSQCSCFDGTNFLPYLLMLLVREHSWTENLAAISKQTWLNCYTMHTFPSYSLHKLSSSYLKVEPYVLCTYHSYSLTCFFCIA
jgi:hypothetical protein